MLHLYLKDEIAERPDWDWGWRRCRQHPFLPAAGPLGVQGVWFKPGSSILLLAFHLLIQFKRLLSASYIIHLSEEMRTLLVGAHICIPFVSRWGISH